MLQILSVGADVGEVEAGKKVSNQIVFSFGYAFSVSGWSLKQFWCCWDYKLPDEWTFSYS